MADYLLLALDAGDPVAYAKTHPDEYARYHVLAAKLHDLHRDPWRSQQEIALAVGQVYPVWELLHIEAGTSTRLPSPLSLPPDVTFAGKGDPAAAISFLISLSPVGDVYDGAAAFIGRDPLTGESLKWWERCLAGLGLLPLISGKALGEALGMISKGGRSADRGRALAMEMLRKALPDLTEAGAANMVRFMEWADARLLGPRIAEAAEELVKAGAGPMVAKWLSELEPEEAVRMIEHYRYNRHLLGVLNEARMGQEIKRLVAEQKALLLHFNESVTHGGADLIWIDLTTNRVVFADVKASVSGSTFGEVPTFQVQMRQNVDRARGLIKTADGLTVAEKRTLLEGLDRNEFDVQVVLAGTAQASAGLIPRLKATLEHLFPNSAVRDIRRLD